MSKIILSISILISVLCGVWYLSVPQQYVTRVSVITGPRVLDGELSLIPPQFKVEDYFQQMVEELNPDVKILAIQSTQGSRIFFDFKASNVDEVKPLARKIFFAALQKQINLVDEKYPNAHLLAGYSSVIDFYYSNLLSRINVDQGNAFMTFRFNYIFIDRETKSGLKYVIFAVIAMVLVNLAVWQIRKI
ncbi:hypothetical protein DOM22_09395 [Bdellovibrio sp. ZAP7]|uniref:hypothetical protein n=1 Tax=Bdellovibrio sp. ZAP7 TaxID=2231053 RepID=UPI00115BABA6|nr:hypothetical protein [Bdellovibrio sp. ZAP7]QDK45351.1 hypothetical protein DOM22_09395 [Bdellovibrio sp. ZAP7]